jgi:glutamate/aspartate transport system permease protein
MTGFDFGVIADSLDYLFRTGMAFTLQLTGLAMVGGIVIGTLLALMRLSGLRLVAGAAGLYVNTVRLVAGDFRAV